MILHRFIIPYRLHSAAAKWKASIDVDGPQSAHFQCVDREDAYSRLCRCVVPRDRRPIRGRARVGYFEVRDLPDGAAGEVLRIFWPGRRV